MDHFKVFIEFVPILFLFLFFFHVLVFWPRAMWDVSSPIRDQTCTPTLECEGLTTGEVPVTDLSTVPIVLLSRM